MSKHLRGYTKDGTTFGMDVDGARAARVMKKAEYVKRVNSFGYTVGDLCLRSADVASLMGKVAWLVTEQQDFTHVQFDDSVRYKIIYPEESQALRRKEVSKNEQG